MTAAITSTLLSSIKSNWKKPLFLTAIAASVAAAVAALFLSSQFAAIGYALLGLITFILYKEDGSDTAKLQLLTNQVTQENTELKATTDKMAAFNVLYRQQGEVFEQNRVMLANQVSQLQQETSQLQQAQRSWETQRLNLTQENQHLTQTKASLEKDVSDLKTAYAAIQTQVQQLLQQNLDFGRKVGAFQQAAGKETELATAIQRLDAGMNQDLGQMTKQITDGAKLVQGTIQFYSQQHQNFQNDLAQLAQNLTNLNRREAEINQLSAKLQVNEQNYQRDLENLHQLDEQLKKTTEQLASERSALEEQNKALEEERAKLTEESLRFVSEIGEIQEANQARLEKLIETENLKIQLINVLDQKIKEKTATLKTILEQKKNEH